MTTIGLIRHGITDWNIEGRVQGHSDVPLNATGREQARALANRLASEEWDVIFSSDLIRAVETAEIVADPHGLEVQTDALLREMFFGELEGKTTAEIKQKWGEDWEKLNLGIEQDEAVSDRGIKFIAGVIDRFPGKRILTVSHGVLIHATLKKLMPHVDFAGFMHNTSLSLIEYDGSTWSCPLFNCAKHNII